MIYTKEEIIDLVQDKLNKLNVFIDDVIFEKEGNESFLRIILDSDEIISLDKVVMATRIINPLLDKKDLIKEAYTLDVYAKSKGDDYNE